MLTACPASLIEGRRPATSRRRSEAWRPAAAARTRCPGRYGKPPAGHYDPDARSSHRSGRKSGEGSAAPEPKIATVRAPRRRASRVMGRKAPRKRLACRVKCRPNGCLASTRTTLGAPPPFDRGARSESFKTRAQETRRGNEKGCV